MFRLNTNNLHGINLADYYVVGRRPESQEQHILTHLKNKLFVILMYILVHGQGIVQTYLIITSNASLGLCWFSIPPLSLRVSVASIFKYLNKLFKYQNLPYIS